MQGTEKRPSRAPRVALHLQVRVRAGVPGHFIFGRSRDRSERSHLVPIVEFNGESLRSNLKFRDALRENRSLQTAYLKLKEHAVALVPKG